ncbi:DUF397 domain-containing protein [Streptomyces sp. NPDC001851]|uniref:DUF397 domain-containing protein n=1 Tax=Streptomyces sp. NPDC001851 TaxID=3154529 RepID=UPI00332814A3
MASNEHTVSDSSTFTGWYKSSYSGGTNDDCVEIACGHPVVPVRDSKAATGPALLFPTDSWQSFVTAVKDGRVVGT